MTADICRDGGRSRAEEVERGEAPGERLGAGGGEGEGVQRQRAEAAEEHCAGDARGRSAPRLATTSDACTRRASQATGIPTNYTVA